MKAMKCDLLITMRQRMNLLSYSGMLLLTNQDGLQSHKLYLHVRLRLKIDPTALPAHLPFCRKLAVRQVRQ